ncbi:hypothetical protein K7X08_025813 [Anisodus acutangulus]|uniref:Glycosyl transferase family 3 domain-containing protein n=1 Tax=Anisodus acutangulus TaxID=402998 RepID=A0A9Q1LAN0_9SOLA|nr:hypothetical protein K7X08_025813 [Anisodus acutangulus]
MAVLGVSPIVCSFSSCIISHFQYVFIAPCIRKRWNCVATDLPRSSSPLHLPILSSKELMERLLNKDDLNEAEAEASRDFLLKDGSEALISAFLVLLRAKVAKQGNRSSSSACGSADVLDALGVIIELKPQSILVYLVAL